MALQGEVFVLHPVTSDGDHNCFVTLVAVKHQGRIQGGPGGPGPLTTKNEAPAPKFYKIEAPEWQF